MLCPLTFIRADEDGVMPCGRANCAWWIEDVEEDDGGCCAMRFIALTLNGMFSHALDTEANE